jgi:hypothetical protein
LHPGQVGGKLYSRCEGNLPARERKSMGTKLEKCVVVTESLFQFFGIQKKLTVSETGSFSVLRYKHEETPTRLGALQKADPSHWY